MMNRFDEVTHKMSFGNGILLLNKPVGITSNGALQRVKKLLGLKKAGHTGSLDPLASGMLPLCVGSEATKFSSYLLNANKRYEVCAQLGVRTTTGDAEGEVTVRRDVKNYSKKDIMPVLEQFSGDIEQIPPMFSAIKQNGKPLYELARQGITVEREKRKVHIYELELVETQNDKLLLRVYCSKGTYIRTLIEDIGEALGCGAYVSNLCRTGVGNYEANEMISLSYLEELARASNHVALQSFILPISSCLSHFPSVSINERLLFYLQRGQPVRVSGLPGEGCVRLLTQEGCFLGVGEVTEDGRVAPKRLVKTR